MHSSRGPGICVRLMGGLGNQMFQYAAGRSLALRHNVRLKVDTSFFAEEHNGATPRSFELGAFRLSAAKQMAPMRLLRYSGVRGRIEAAIRPERYVHVKERHFEFDGELWMCAPKNAYLDGYWQSETYFIEFASVIRKDFDLDMQSTGRVGGYFDVIRQVSQPVCVHVRRGDYVSNPSVAAFHGLCSLEYYESAVRRVKQMIADAQLFVFSDDPDWCKSKFLVEHRPTIIEGCSAHEDLWLMSKCRHHVIANSSFSWWGAWLGGHDRQVVVAPKRWFEGKALDTSSLIPSSWQRI